MVWPRISSRVIVLGPLLAGALLLSSCDRLKAKIKGAISRSSESPPASPGPLTPDEQSMNNMLQDPKLYDSGKPEAAAEPARSINKSALVSILGYHDFRESGGSPVLISGWKFRQQMQAIKDSKIPVIPFSQLLAWKRGEVDVPEESIVITMDDGWEGVYKIAYPILKEFNFPFTVYLYKNYVNIGGRSMKWEQIREMMQNGCEIGSHTVSHDSLTNRKKLPAQEYQMKLISELRDSRDFLEHNLGVKVTSLAYPYGVLDDTVVDTTLQIGYEGGVTVSPQKVTWDTPNGRLPRYIVHGEEDTVFRNGTTFRTRGGDLSNKVIAIDAKDDKGEPLLSLSPAPNSVIKERTPVIEANLRKLGSIVPDSIRMRVAGFGVVPHTFDKDTFVVGYQVPSKLRREDCAVSISFKRDLKAAEEMVTWKFKIDLAAAYMPQTTFTVEPQKREAPPALPGETIAPAVPVGR